MDLPWPSTIAGLMRTRAGSNADGRFTAKPSEVLQWAIEGPLVVELSERATAPRLLVPPPRDCLFLQQDAEATPSTGRGKKTLRRIRLGPVPLREGEDTDLQGGLPIEMAAEAPAAKPAPGPALWCWDELLEWLLEPTDDVAVDPKTFGRGAPAHEPRIHVAMSDDGTGIDGALFATDSVRYDAVPAWSGFEPDSPEARDGFGPLQEDTPSRGLVFFCDKKLTPGHVPLGGERRPTRLSSCPSFERPPFPDAWPESADSLVRLVLLTPALFRLGYRPSPERLGDGVELVAWSVPRPEHLSGWDMRRDPDTGRPFGPKPTRRLAPAGSVYWVRLPEAVSVVDWARERWWTSLCDEEQDRRDGFGLTVVGVAP